MTRPIRIAAQIPPAGASSYVVWRDTVLRAEDVGADAIFGYDHFLVPAVTGREERSAHHRAQPADVAQLRELDGIGLMGGDHEPR